MLTIVNVQNLLKPIIECSQMLTLKRAQNLVKPNIENMIKLEIRT